METLERMRWRLEVDGEVEAWRKGGRRGGGGPRDRGRGYAYRGEIEGQITSKVSLTIYE